MKHGLPPSTKEKPLSLTYRQFAKAANISESMTRKLAYARKLRVIHIGRAARIPASELARVLEEGI